MKTIFIHELKFARKNLFIWSGVLLLLAGMGAAEYPAIHDGGVQIAPMMGMMPKVMRLMFGIYDQVSIDTQLGYYICLLLWYYLLNFIHAAVTGASMISKEEANATAEYLFTKPKTRSAIITAKILAGGVQCLVMFLLTYLITYFGYIHQPGWREVMPFIQKTLPYMGFMQLVFLAIGFMISSLIHSSSKAIQASVIYVLICYGLAVTVELTEIQSLTYFTPFWYFNGPALISGEPKLIFYILSIAIMIISFVITYKQYQKRDFI